tara:strand:- start:379 stop:582 length:204 start_codon:yes stop_codon:yes gene_type:complete
MKNREFIYRKLESLEHTLINLQRIVNTQEPIETYKVNIGKALGTMEDIRTAIEREPRTAQEQNKLVR